MRIALIGAPGSGKTHIAKFIANYFNILHIHSDDIFWQGKNLRIEVSKHIQESHWVIEGHLSKLSDLVFPVVDKVIVIDGLNLRSLFRSLTRDWKNLKRAWHNIQYYEKMASNRKLMTDELLQTRKEDVLFLNNFPDLRESDLATFCENLKSSTVKTKKPAIKC